MAAGAGDKGHPRKISYIYKTGRTIVSRKRQVQQLPHLEWHGTAAGEVGEGRASEKSAAEPATAIGDFIAVRRMGGDVDCGIFLNDAFWGRNKIHY